MDSPSISDAAPPQRLFTTRVCRGLGLLLLIAAGLKIYGFGVDPVARSGIFSTPAFQFLVITFELALGVWLVSGRQLLGAWLAVLVTFSAFAAVSFYQGWIGQASCGCLGNKVTVSPWVMFAVDSAAVIALLTFRPCLTPLWENRGRVATAAIWVVTGYVLILSLLAGIAYLQFGSVDFALARLRSDRVSVQPSLVNVGEGVPGEIREVRVELTNRTEKSIRILGGTSDCSCSVLGDLPITIPPGEGRNITLGVRLQDSPGIFNRNAMFVVDDNGLRKLRIRITGRIRTARN